MDWNEAQLHTLLQRVNDRMLHLTNDFMQESCPIGIIDFDKWEWPQGVGLYGMWKYYRLTGETQYRDYLVAWYEARLAQGLPERNVNTTAPMLTLAFLAEEMQDPAWKRLCHDWAEWVVEQMPRTEEGGLQHIVSGEQNEQQMWDDTLFMTVMFLAKMAEVEDREDWRQEAAYQFQLHAKYLQDEVSGLWYHGWCFQGRHHFAGAFWARGNCWITAGIPEYLEIAQTSPALRRFLVGLLENQVRALEQYQDEGGLWHTLIDDKTSYLESSASAGFAYGILKAVHMGILSRRYEPMALRAARAVVQEIDENGVVGKVSYGTGMGWDLDHYRNIPCCPMAYGQSLPVMMLGEVLKGGLA